MDAEFTRRTMPRRYRRRIVGWGALVLVTLTVVGSVISLRRVESDLSNRSDATLDAAGLDGVAVDFSGQDGTIECDGDGDVPTASVLEELRGLRGVRSIVVGSSCSADVTEPDAEVDSDDENGGESTSRTTTSAVGDGTTPDTEPSDGSATSAPLEESVADIVESDSAFSTLSGLSSESGLHDVLAGPGPVTLFAPTDEAFEALGPDTIAALGREPALLAAVMDHHATDVRLAEADLDDGEVVMLDGTPVVIARNGEITVSSGDVEARVLGSMSASNGVVHSIDRVLLPPGFELPPDTVPTAGESGPATTAPAAATEASAAELEEALNALVRDEPILFAPGSAVVPEDSADLVERIAALVSQSGGGVTIEVRGFTDTDGDPDANQVLSAQRAAAVRDALVAAGLDGASVTSVGFGGTQVVVDAAGSEDKAASRRVEFEVSAA